MRTFFLLTVVAGLFVVSGCGEAETAPADPATTESTSDPASETKVTLANEVCPIMGEPVKDDGGTAEWNGKTVGFCCPGCVEKWEALSDEEKAAKLSGEETASTDPADEETVACINTNCPIMGHPVKPNGGSADWNGKTVGFCCPGCIEKWEALSDEAKTTKLTEANPAEEEAGA